MAATSNAKNGVAITSVSTPVLLLFLSRLVLLSPSSTAWPQTLVGGWGFEVRALQRQIGTKATSSPASRIRKAAWALDALVPYRIPKDCQYSLDGSVS